MRYGWWEVEKNKKQLSVDDYFDGKRVKKTITGGQEKKSCVNINFISNWAYVHWMGWDGEEELYLTY